MSEINNEKFDLQIVHDLFKRSVKDDDDVILEHYLEAYKELYKFFQLLGSVFSFVSSDVKAKVEILETFKLDKDVGQNFTTIKTMIEYEKNDELLENMEYVSGSRTLLRLHRGLDFIREFLRSLGELQGCEKTCSVCQTSYNNTLAKYHPWIIRKGAVVAMYALPIKNVLLKKVCGSDQEVKKAAEILPKALKITNEIYSRTENLYTIHDLHKLP